MEVLGEKVKFRGFDYILEKRTDKVAIYQQWLEDTFIGYEVFFIQHKPAQTLLGIEYPEREWFPRDEDWGELGWTIKDGKRAEKKYEELTK